MPDPEVTIRRATAADSATLSRVDASAPIVEGSKSIAIDRAPDYMSHRRIMGPSADGADGEPTILVAEVDGEIAGVYCGTIHTAPIDGRARRLRFLFGARILPQYQGLGIGRTLAGALRQAYKDDLGESMYYFIVRGNEAAESAVRGIGERWTVEAAWAHIDTGIHNRHPDRHSDRHSDPSYPPDRLRSPGHPRRRPGHQRHPQRWPSRRAALQPLHPGSPQRPP